MPEVWGLMPKAQDNDQKIDDAIAAAIANHESDSEAHLGDGESLQSHKAGDILDHRIGSVLFDKLSLTEMLLQTNFDSLDRWTLIGSQYQVAWPGVTLYCTNVTNTISVLYTEAMARAGMISGDKDSFFQTTVRIWEDDSKIAMFGNMYYSGESPTQGYGFRLVSGVMYGFWYTNSGLQTVELSDVDYQSFNVYRAQYDQANRKVSFYVNGTQKGSITKSDYTMDIDFIIVFYLKTKATAEAYMDISNLIVSSQI